MNPRRGQRAGSGPRRRRGVILLEVILALALFVFATAVISGGLHAALNRVERLHQEVHAADLAASALAEVQLGLRSAQNTGTETLPAPFTDWTLEVQSEPRIFGFGGGGGLSLVTVVVRHAETSTTVRLSQLLPDTPLRAPADSASDPWSGSSLAATADGFSR